jgi:Kef-type K+ transport system membrane component KefB
MISLLLTSGEELGFFGKIWEFFSHLMIEFGHWVAHVWELLYENPIFGVAALVIFGLLGGKLISLLKFPRVTGYILIGILIGPSVLRLLSTEMVHNFTIIRQIAIGFIGYTIGLELRFNKLKKTGKQVTIITLVQALTTAILVCLAVVAYLTVTNGKYIWTYGLILGAIATATAPGPIVAVVKSYRTKGPVTDVLLPLVALDDAIGIMLFAVMLSLGTSFLSGPVSVGAMLLEPLMEIVLSFGLGGIIGLLLTVVAKKFNRESDSFLMMVIIGSVFMGIALGQAVHASAILLPMTIGIVLTNSIDERYEHRLTQTTDLFSAPILLAFFTIAGAELELSLLASIGVLGVIYLLVRVIGKITGSYFSARALKAPPTVIKYLGFTLIPQAGVAIDMALTTKLRFETTESLANFQEVGSVIMTIVLAATVIYEVFGLLGGILISLL